jgi:AcrR family transcriptional regulator
MSQAPARRRAPTPAAVPAKPDGRRERSAASRARIVEALLAFCQEGDYAPNADAVAERAGVGRRTVFRLFKDMDSLYGEMRSVMLSRIEHIRQAPIEGADWRERLDNLTERRIRFFEEIMPIKMAAEAHRYRSAFLQVEHSQTTRMLRDLLRFVAPKELVDDSVRFEALDMALSIEAWRRLRHEQGLTVRAASQVVKRVVSALVD